MQTYIAILRGINVSGNRTIRMDALRQMFIDLGFDGVKSYIQSGNIIFRSSTGAERALEQIISAEILVRFGFQVPVIVINHLALKIILEQNPYLQDHDRDLSHLQVTFLAQEPDQGLTDSFNNDRSLLDEFKTGDRCVYLYCPNGYSKTKISNSLIESRLKVTATTRNWKTCNELLALATPDTE